MYSWVYMYTLVISHVTSSSRYKEGQIISGVFSGIKKLYKGSETFHILFYTFYPGVKNQI